MAVPSKAEYWTLAGTIIDAIDDIVTSGMADINTQFDTIEQLFEGNRLAGVTTFMDSARQSSTNVVDQMRSALAEVFLDMARTQYNVVHGGDVVVALKGIRKEMAALSESIRYRNTTRDTIAYGGTNVGSGKGYRCHTDKYNKAMEAGYVAQKITADCILDKNTGGTASGREQFNLWGEGRAPRDHFDIGTATASSKIITAIRSKDCLLQNGSFEEGTGQDGTTSAITGWSIPSGGSGSFGTEIMRTSAETPALTTDDKPFRAKPGTSTGRCLQLTAGVCDLEQKFSVRNLGKSFDPGRPVITLARIRPSTGTAFVGTMNWRLGSQTDTLAHGAMSVGWTDKELFSFDGQYAWYDNFKENDVRIQFGLSAWTQGSLYVDELLFYQPSNDEFFDGGYYIITAGQTDWLRTLYATTDTMDWTDTSSDTGEMQYWIQYLFGVYMPHVTTSETYADV